MNATRLTLAASLLLACTAAPLLAQGPPFQIDDPVPVDFRHYEFYVFATAGGTPVEHDFAGPALEFNWGAIPRVQLHAVLPWGTVAPASGGGPTRFGLMDAELGAKIAIFKETDAFPQIGTFPMLELPTGNADNGLGVGKAWFKLPIWLQKNIGKWLLDGGGGYTVVPQTGFRNFSYGGFLVKYSISERLELGAEVFSHGAEGDVTPQYKSSTLVDFGGYYHFHDPNKQLLFCYGRNIAGLSENYAYVGLYWTWGNDKEKSSTPGDFMGQQANRLGRH